MTAVIPLWILKLFHTRLRPAEVLLGGVFSRDVNIAAFAKPPSVLFVPTPA
jgi:hypothetical protein